MHDPELEAFYGVIAPHYDEDYADLLNGADIAFYRALAGESGGPVLEMGCGSGRVLLPIARAGIPAHGMDGSAAMLEQLRAKLRGEPVTLTYGDIRSAAAGARFPLVYAAGNVLHSFLERADQRAWLRNVRRHLAPGGSFCFDVFQFDYRYLALPPEQWNVDADHTDPATGRRNLRYSRCVHEPEWQRFRVEMRWETQDANGRTLAQQTASVMQRWFTRPELECLLELEGFQITDYWGNFNREPYGKGATHQIVRAL